MIKEGPETSKEGKREGKTDVQQRGTKPSTVVRPAEDIYSKLNTQGGAPQVAQRRAEVTKAGSGVDTSKPNPNAEAEAAKRILNAESITATGKGGKVTTTADHKGDKSAEGSGLELDSKDKYRTSVVKIAADEAARRAEKNVSELKGKAEHNPFQAAEGKGAKPDLKTETPRDNIYNPRSAESPRESVLVSNPSAVTKAEGGNQNRSEPTKGSTDKANDPNAKRNSEASPQTATERSVGGVSENRALDNRPKVERPAPTVEQVRAVQPERSSPQGKVAETSSQYIKREETSHQNRTETRQPARENSHRTHPEQKTEHKTGETRPPETHRANTERPPVKEASQTTKEHSTKGTTEPKVEIKSQSATKELRTEKVVASAPQTQEPIRQTKTTQEKPVQEPVKVIQKAQETPQVIERSKELSRSTQVPIKEREIRVGQKAPERIEIQAPQVKSTHVVQERELPRPIETKEIQREIPRTLTEKVEKEILSSKPEREVKIVVPTEEVRKTPDPQPAERLAEARVIQEIEHERVTHQHSEVVLEESEAPILDQSEYTLERLEERVEERIESRIEVPETELDDEPTVATELAGRASDDAADLNESNIQLLSEELEVSTEQRAQTDEKLEITAPSIQPDEQEDLVTAIKELNEIVDQQPERVLELESNVENRNTIQLSPAETEFLETLRDSHGITIETLAELQSVLRSLDNSYVPEAVVPEVQQELKHILHQVAHTLAQQVQDGETPKNIRDLIPHERIRKLILDALHEIQLRQRLAELEAGADKGKEDSTIKKITKEVIQEIKKLLQIDEPIEDFEIELDPNQEQELQEQDLEQQSREPQSEKEPEDAFRFEEEREDRDLSVYEISGQVIDLDTGNGLPGVTIFGGLLGRTSTDLYGFYRFRNIPRGTGYTIGPDKPGYRFTPEAVSGTISISTRHDFVGKRRIKF